MSESQIIVPRKTETLNGVTTASPVEERDVQAKSKRRLRTAAAAAALGKDCGGASFARPSDHRDEGRETAAVHHGTCEPRAVGLFECDYCGGTFKWKSSLSRHFRTHTGERPYAGEVCGKVFTQHANLVRHRRTHTGERPYACGKTFRMKASLVAHNRSHTGERPYACDVCGKTFVRRTGLMQHYKTYSGERRLLRLRKNVHAQRRTVVGNAVLDGQNYLIYNYSFELL